MGGISVAPSPGAPLVVEPPELVVEVVVVEVVVVEVDLEDEVDVVDVFVLLVEVVEVVLPVPCKHLRIYH